MGYASRFDVNNSHLTVSRATDTSSAERASRKAELEKSLITLRELGLSDAVSEIERAIEREERAAEGELILSRSEISALEAALSDSSLGFLGVTVDETGVDVGWGESGKFYYPEEDMNRLINAVPGLVFNGVITVEGEDFSGYQRVLVEDNKVTIQVPDYIVWKNK